MPEVLTETEILTKYERAEIANKMLITIATRGRKFFAYQDRVSQFDIDHRGRIWFIDKYTQKRICVSYRGRWRGFSEGGTLQALIERLRDFIAQGKALPPTIFGPWPEWVCGGDLWGYGDAMEQVRQAAKDLRLTTTS